MATVCPITTRTPNYPGEVPIPVGHAGQSRDGLILAHQVRTIDLRRATALEVGGAARLVTDSGVRRAVRVALAHQLGLDIRSALDGAGAPRDGAPAGQAGAPGAVSRGGEVSRR